MDQDAEQLIPSKNATETQIKHAAALILSDAGLGPTAIGKAIERTPQHVCTTLTKLKKESLQHPEMLKLAGKSIKSVFKGWLGHEVQGPQPDGSLRPVLIQDHRVKASDVIKAAEMVYDRVEPVPQEGQGPSQQLFFQVNQQFFLPKD